MTARIAFVVVGGLMLVQAIVLYLLGRVWICECGTIRMWVGDTSVFDRAAASTCRRQSPW